MAKLSTTRNFGNYGPPTTRNNYNWEYINAGIYIAATVLLLAGFVAQVLPDGIDGGFGLAVIIIGLILIAIVNTHDFVAHSIGIDFSIPLNEFDPQLSFVEIYVSLWHIVGDVLTAIALIFFMVQGRSWAWLGLFGSLLFLIGGLMNVIKVFKMHQIDTGRLESLRGGALEGLMGERVGWWWSLLLEGVLERLMEERVGGAPILL